MFKRLASFGVALAALGFVASPASARHHRGETPEPGRHGGGGKVGVKHRAQAGDDRGKNAGKDGANDKNDDRGKNRRNDGADDGPNHK